MDENSADKPRNAARSETLTLQVDSSTKGAGLDLDRAENGSVRSTQRNALTLLLRHPRWRGVIGLDLRRETACFLRKSPAYSGADETFPRDIIDTDVTAIIAWICHQTGAEFPESKISRAVDLVAREQAFDPVTQYLESLQWDGRSRLDDWLITYMGAPASEYSRVVGPKFLISGVARALTPGCQVDHVLVLEGAQGIGKTSALRILAAPYHRADPPPLGTRDAKEALRGCWIVEIGELDSMNKSELSAVKNFLSQTEDHYRVPYGRRSETRSRRVIFAATTNDTEYLRDHTGNRRFWPVECARIDLARLAEDRDQLWAEAVVRFKRGEPWHLTKLAEHKLATMEQERRVEIDPWEDRVAERIVRHSEVTASQILVELEVPVERQGQKEKNRVARILQRLGYRRRQVRDGDKRKHVYSRAESGATPPGRSAPSPVSPVAPSTSRAEQMGFGTSPPTVAPG